MILNKLQLKEFRKEYKLSVQDLADIAKVSVFAVKNWESGSRNISQSALALLTAYAANSEQDTLNDEQIETNSIETNGLRLADYIKQKKISIKDFALKCDINYNNTASLLKGSLPLGMGVLQKIKKAFPELNTEWVLFGNGTMELNTQLVSQNTKEVEQLEQVNYLLNSALRDKDKTISSLENQIALLQELKDIKTQDVSPVKSNVDR